MASCDTKTGLLKPGEHATPGVRVAIVCFNAIACPFLLIWHAVTIYAAPCVYIYFRRFFCWLFCQVCKCTSWMYHDATFTGPSALGEIEASVEIEWKRGTEIREASDKTHPHLFEGGIDAADIAQGALGDCWLMSAFACLAEKHGAIENVFGNREFNPRGKYTIYLWDAVDQRWEGVDVDDTIPFDKNSGRPAFAKPKSDELWVLLLEKAFAKFCGSYHEIEGGVIAWALEAMTGDQVASYYFEDGKWIRLEMKHAPTASNVRQVKHLLTDDKRNNDEMFDLLKKFDDKGCVIGCGSKGKDNTLTEGRQESGGIVPGHAYTVLQVYESYGFKLIQLRNPWGTFEWNGDWSDNSDMWSKHPMVKSSVRVFAGGVSKADDGSFWMSWEDFLKFFDNVDVCFIDRGMNELFLDSHEHLGTCGPAVGCVKGCAWFWCACQGPYKMICNRDGSDSKTVHDLENPLVPNEH